MILVTGTSGFLGTHLLEFLIKEYGADHILALTSQPIDKCRYLLHHNYEFGEDYFVAAGYGSVGAIIHAGAYIPKNSRQLNDWKNCNRNILTTDRLLKAAFPALKKLIFISTVDVYGADAVISENSPVAPGSLYGASKFYCEQMITAWGKEMNKVTQVLRLGHIYGPGEHFFQKIIPLTMLNIMKGRPVQLVGNGDVIRSFMYVSDVAALIQKALLLEESQDPINITGSGQTTITNLIHMLIRISGRKDVIIESLPSKTRGRDLVFDNARMRTLLGAEETVFEEGLRREWENMNSLQL